MSERTLHDYESAPLPEPRSFEMESDALPPSHYVSPDHVFTQRGSSQDMDSGDEGGGDSSLSYTIYYADGTVATLTLAVINADYDPDPEGEAHTDWSINFEVLGGEMSQAVTYSDDTVRFPDDGANPAAQTFYRLPIVRGGLTVSSGGVYQEDTLCLNGEGRQQLLKMG